MFIAFQDYEFMARVKKGEQEMVPPFVQLFTWIVEQYNIPVVYFILDRTEDSQHCTKLRMFVETMEDVKALMVEGGTLHSDFKFKREIQERFVRLMQENGRESYYDLDHIVFTIWNFDALAREDAYKRSASEVEEYIIREYAWAPIHKVYTLFGLSVFYETDEQLASAWLIGLNDKIKEDFFQILKKHDDFNYFTPDNIDISFDSHENVEKNYQGSYYFYFK